MERKVEQLLLNGVNLLIGLKDLFIEEWKQLLSSSNYKNPTLVDQFDSMIQFAFQEISIEYPPSADSFILSLLAEWQTRFSSAHEESEAIFLVTAIENIFHKLLSANPSTSILDHQAIQAFFSRILDHTLLTQDLEDRIEKWIKMMMATNIIPMEWLAIVKKEQIDFKIEKVVCSAKNKVEKHLIEMCLSIKANHIDHLSMAITRLLGESKVHNNVIQIPCLNDILLIGLQEVEVSVTEQQKELIKGMYLRQLKLHHLESKMEWKDASLLYLQRLLQSKSADCAVQAITQGITDYMPFKRCALFLYNHNENKGIGVSGYNVSSPSVRQIREAIFQLPLINNYFSSLTHSQPLYFSNASDVLPEKYVREYRLKSIVVLPIFVPAENKLLGIALLDQGEDSQFEVATQTLTTLIKFGHYAGELLNSIWDEALQQFGSSNCVLTQREKEVLRLIADGASINEAAQQLHLSSYTVRDYVSNIIQKLSAKNRTDAAVKAIRMKLIS
ncbi:LuxR C-terminal-related transcriptional regulator [Neobacillus ginsengisoli]|uniref:DNA-binding CsgD family transcriptional regulator n=1 Tax=Neobacillus ginsengisoli TaxID=904295 RepID=A0ABT9XYG3_9BACI|nr:LuxR C-terminal-related transcriptional regulator [Neobacillus ginsengisoli]MDQ0200602.1 DNA-binding CsgD family transcriptional regulator [Neobacillus ginsengisoli]